MAGLIGTGVTLLSKPTGVPPEATAVLSSNLVLPTRPVQPVVVDTRQKDVPSTTVTAPSTVAAPTTVVRPSTKKQPATTRQADPPKPPAQTPAPGHAGLVPIARSFIGQGIRYVYGGKSPATGLDCSSFVWVVLKKAGYDVPYRSSSALSQWAIPIKADQLQLGDLVFFYSPVGHVGIYAGPGTIIDNGTPAGPKQSTIWGTPTYGRIPL